MGFSEVTGGRVLSFSNLSMGETAAPSFSEENAEGAKIYPPLAESPIDKLLEKTSPRALELKKMSTLFSKI